MLYYNIYSHLGWFRHVDICFVSIIEPRPPALSCTTIFVSFSKALVIRAHVSVPHCRFSAHHRFALGQLVHQRVDLLLHVEEVLLGLLLRLVIHFGDVLVKTHRRGWCVIAQCRGLVVVYE